MTDQHFSARPVCVYCNNKIDNNVYIWDEQRQIVTHKTCKMVTDQMRKDVTITLGPARMGAKTNR